MLKSLFRSRIILWFEEKFYDLQKEFTTLFSHQLQTFVWYEKVLKMTDGSLRIFILQLNYPFDGFNLLNNSIFVCKCSLWVLLSWNNSINLPGNLVSSIYATYIIIIYEIKPICCNILSFVSMRLYSGHFYLWSKSAKSY